MKNKCKTCVAYNPWKEYNSDVKTYVEVDKGYCKMNPPHKRDVITICPGVIREDYWPVVSDSDYCMQWVSNEQN